MYCFSEDIKKIQDNKKYFISNMIGLNISYQVCHAMSYAMDTVLSSLTSNPHAPEPVDDNNNNICENILIAMDDIVKNTRDTLWISDTETVFERLSHIFTGAGGSMEFLEARFPDMF